MILGSVIFPEGILFYDVQDSGRGWRARRQLVVLGSSRWKQLKELGISILAKFHCLDVKKNLFLCFFHKMVGAGDSARPPGKI